MESLLHTDFTSPKINLRKEILRLKKEKNTVILTHYYQNPKIQEIADYIGDNLGLSQMAAETNACIIVLAGLHFMAETAKILNIEKKVLLPDVVKLFTSGLGLATKKRTIR